MINKTVKILDGGHFDGAAGVVEDISEGGWALVYIEGVVNGELVSVRERFDVEKLEVLYG